MSGLLRVPSTGGLNLLKCAKVIPTFYISSIFHYISPACLVAIVAAYFHPWWMGSEEKCEIIIQTSHYGSLVQAVVTLVCLAATSPHCSVLSYCTSAQHLSSSSTESWWLLSSHLFLPHYLFTKHKAGQGAVRSFTGKVFICLKLVNTVKCTEPALCSAAVLQCCSALSSLDAGMQTRCS